MPNPALNPLAWLGRVLAVRAFVKQMDARGYVRGTEAAADAIRVASSLVKEGSDEAAAVARLRAMPGGREALQNAAEMLARYADHGYPHGPMYRLLRAASGAPIEDVSSEELAAETRARQLAKQPVATAFAELAEQVPGLRRLEDSLRTDPAKLLNEASPADIAMLGGMPRPDSRGRQLLMSKTLVGAVSRLVGPKSGQPDPVLSSSVAWKVAFDYLNELTGIGPEAPHGRP